MDTDELVAVAEGILGQRVTWEGFMGEEGGDLHTCVTARGGGDGEGDDKKHSEEGARMVAYGVPLEG